MNPISIEFLFVQIGQNNPHVIEMFLHILSSHVNDYNYLYLEINLHNVVACNVTPQHCPLIVHDGRRAIYINTLNVQYLAVIKTGNR